MAHGPREGRRAARAQAHGVALRGPERKARRAGQLRGPRAAGQDDPPGGDDLAALDLHPLPGDHRGDLLADAVLHPRAGRRDHQGRGEAPRIDGRGVAQQRRGDEARRERGLELRGARG